MAFIGPPSAYIGKETLIEVLKECIAKCINKYEHPGMIMQASVMYIRGITGGLFYADGMKPPDLNIILTDFNSDEGKRAAGSVRAFIMTEFMPLGDKPSDHWAKLFWNQGYKLDQCQFPWKNNE